MSFTDAFVEQLMTQRKATGGNQAANYGVFTPVNTVASGQIDRLSRLQNKQFESDLAASQEQSAATLAANAASFEEQMSAMTKEYEELNRQLSESYERQMAAITAQNQQTFQSFNQVSQQPAAIQPPPTFTTAGQTLPAGTSAEDYRLMPFTGQWVHKDTPGLTEGFRGRYSGIPYATFESPAKLVEATNAYNLQRAGSNAYQYPVPQPQASPPSVQQPQAPPSGNLQPNTVYKDKYSNTPYVQAPNGGKFYARRGGDETDQEYQAKLQRLMAGGGM